MRGVIRPRRYALTSGRSTQPNCRYRQSIPETPPGPYRPTRVPTTHSTPALGCIYSKYHGKHNAPPGPLVLRVESQLVNRWYVYLRATRTRPRPRSGRPRTREITLYEDGARKNRGHFFERDITVFQYRGVLRRADLDARPGNGLSGHNDGAGSKGVGGRSSPLDRLIPATTQIRGAVQRPTGIKSTARRV